MEIEHCLGSFRAHYSRTTLIATLIGLKAFCSGTEPKFQGMLGEPVYILCGEVLFHCPLNSNQFRPSLLLDSRFSVPPSSLNNYSWPPSAVWFLQINIIWIFLIQPVVFTLIPLHDIRGSGSSWVLYHTFPCLNFLLSISTNCKRCMFKTFQLFRD